MVFFLLLSDLLYFRVKKIPLDKQKIVSLSRLKPSQWNELLSNFHKLGVGKRTIKEKLQKAVESEDCNVEVGNYDLIFIWQAD